MDDRCTVFGLETRLGPAVGPPLLFFRDGWDAATPRRPRDNHPINRRRHAREKEERVGGGGGGGGGEGGGGGGGEGGEG